MDNLISAEYQQTLQAMHARHKNWGSSAVRFLKQICEIIDTRKPTDVLDYGCGKAVLYRELSPRYPYLPIDMYDPGIPEFDHEPQPADFVICTDVLEHIEPEKIDAVLEHLASLTGRLAYFVIHTGDCGHKLPDGRPAHILQKPQEWWENKIMDAYDGLWSFSFTQTGLPNRFQVKIERAEHGTA